MNLPDTYRQLEQDARNYADADRALRVMRRRRTVRTTVGAAFAVLVIAGGVGLQQTLTHSTGDTIAAIPSASGAAEPSATYPALPAQGAVGVGAAVYAPCRYSCPTLLSLTNGRTYLLGTHTVTPPGNITLSPDGRWLGMPTENGYELRDLLGDTTHRLDDPSDTKNRVYSPWAWSADSRRLILGYHKDGDVGRYAELELATGKVTTLSPPQGYEPVGTTSSGDLILLNQAQYGGAPRRQVTLRVGDSDVTFRATGSGVLSDTDHGLSVQVGGGRVFLLEYSGEDVAVLAFDEKGEMVSRTALAAGEYAVGPTQDGYAVTQIPRDQKNGLQRLLIDGRVLREFPGEAEIVVPGGARH